MKTPWQEQLPAHVVAFFAKHGYSATRARELIELVAQVLDEHLDFDFVMLSIWRRLESQGYTTTADGLTVLRPGGVYHESFATAVLNEMNLWFAQRPRKPG